MIQGTARMVQKSNSKIARRQAWLRQRAERTAAVEAARDELHRRFPDCFAGRGARKRALALGIFREVRAAASDLQPKLLRLAISSFVGGPSYLRSVTLGAPRIDLAGRVVGRVTDREAQYAVLRLEQLEQKWQRLAARTL